jgi:hypothetical protein
MTEWTRIYSRVKVSSPDGFTFITLPNVTFPEEEVEKFIKKMLPKEKHDNEFAMARAKADPISALRMYLCATMSGTFCIGRGSLDKQSVFYVGARRPQDIFKLLLKIPDATKVSVWESGMDFSIRVAEGDDFDPEKHKRGTRPRGWAI